MSLYIMNQEQVAEMVADAVKRADRKTVMRVLIELSGLLKCDDTELYSTDYQPENGKQYHFGRMDGLE